MAKFTRSNNAILPDGDRVWDANQSMDVHRIVNAQDAVDPQDYITKAQTYPRITETDATSGVYTIHVNWTTGTTDVEAVGGGTIGTPFKTPHLAFEWLADYSIDADVTIEIQCVAGFYLLTELLHINHPQGSQIHLLGETETGTIDSGISTTVGGIGRDKTVGIDVSAWSTTPQAGWFALFYDVTGNDSSVYNGGYEVLAGAASGNFEFRFHGDNTTATALEAPVTAGVSGEITFIKTIFIFDVGTGTGIFLDHGTNLGLMDKIVVRTVIANEFSGNGIWVRSSSTLKLGGDMVVSGWDIGIWTRFSAVINHISGGHASCVNCNYGALLEYASTFDGPEMAYTNCGVGATAKDCSTFNIMESRISNNSKGVELSNNSSAEAALTKIKYNEYGIYLWHSSSFRIGPNAGTSVVSNTSRGIVMRFGNTCHMYNTTLNNNGGVYGSDPVDISLFLNNTIRLISMDNTTDYDVLWPEANESRLVYNTYGFFLNPSTEIGEENTGIVGAGGDIVSVAV